MFKSLAALIFTAAIIMVVEAKYYLVETEGGNNCVDDNSCQVNGAWSKWSQCTKTCGSGTRSRRCTKPKPANGGSTCTGDDKEECNKQKCPGSCSCIKHMNDFGYGDCQKNSSRFGHKVICYVEPESTCTDKKPSVLEWGMYVSHLACLTNGPVHQCPPRIEEDDLGPYFIPNTELSLSGDIAPSDEVNLRVEGVVYDSSCRPVAGAKVEVWHASPHNDGKAYYTCLPSPLTCTGEPCTEDVVDPRSKKNPRFPPFSSCARQCIPGLCNGTTPSGGCSMGDQTDNWDEGILTQKLWYRGKGYTDEDGHYWYTTSFPGIYNARAIPHIHYKVTYPGRKELVTQMYFKGHIPAGFENFNVKKTNQIVKLGRCKKSQCATFNIHPGKASIYDPKIKCPF